MLATDNVIDCNLVALQTCAQLTGYVIVSLSNFVLCSILHSALATCKRKYENICSMHKKKVLLIHQSNFIVGSNIHS